MPRTAPKGHAVLGALAVAALAGLGLISIRGLSMPLTAATDLELATNLQLVGLDAESLAAAGVSAPHTTALVQAARAHLNDNLSAITAAQASLVSTANTHEALRAKVQSGLASENEVSQLATAASALASARSSLNTAYAALFNAATTVPEDLSAPQIQALSTMQANRAWSLPTPHLAATRPQADWLTLREALAVCRMAAACGAEPDPAAETTVDTAEAVAATASALSNLQANGPSVVSAWEAALE